MSFGKAGTMHDWTLNEQDSASIIKGALDLGILLRIPIKCSL